MRIITLKAENFKRLKAVEITPDGNTVILSGKNGAGKTSVLDAIWAVLSNPRSKELPKPIREGQRKATITVKLDEQDLEVTRIFTAGGTRLEIVSKDGAVFKSPQALLDGFLGELSFDPLAFMQLSEKEQTQLLLGIVPLEVDLDDLAEQRKTLYDERTIVNRTLQEAKAQIPDITPEAVERVSVSDSVVQLEQARTLHRKHEDLDREVSDLAVRIENNNAEIDRLTNLNSELRAVKTDKASARDRIDIPNIESIQARIAHAEVINQQADEYDRYVENRENYKTRQRESDALTSKIEAIDQQKADAVAKAEFPIDGLGFDEIGVIYNGIPMKQISDAEQLRVSLAIAMAANPELRVIRIRNGSLLDSTNLKVIEEMAQDNDFQVWIERVDESGEIGIVIEDGQIKEQS